MRLQIAVTLATSLHFRPVTIYSRYRSSGSFLKIWCIIPVFSEKFAFSSCWFSAVTFVTPYDFFFLINKNQKIVSVTESQKPP